MGYRLYERDAELAALDDVVSALGRGRGSAVLIEARAGRGKSTLVEHAVTAAVAMGARVLVARARHLESAAPFEVLRRLLGPAVEESGGPETLTGAARFAAPLFTPGAEITQGVDYGSQWLVARLAEQAPLVLAVDDAHWADAASLRVLLEVQAEISVQPVVLLLASRPVENPDAQRRLATMAAAPDCVVLTPGLLSREGVRAVVVDAVGEPVHDQFVDSCLQASAGNAFYLHELLRPYRSGFRPDQQTFVKDGGMSLRRTMSWRLGELGPDAAELAQAAAVLGDGCSLHIAGELAGLVDAVAVAEAARLEAASVFGHGDPIDFVHPLIRSAVEATLEGVKVGELHARAARLLRARESSPREIVQHLVQAPGAGDPDVAALLARQGEAALELGSVAVAARLLRRALDEPPPTTDQPMLLISLARAERALGELAEARRHLESTLDHPDRALQLAAAAELFEVFDDAGTYEDMAELHGRVIAMRPSGSTSADVRLRSQLMMNTAMGISPDLEALPGDLGDIDTDQLPVDRGVDRYHLVVAAIFERTSRQGGTERFSRNVARAVASLPEDAERLEYWDVYAALLASAFTADEDLGSAEGILHRIAPAVSRLSGAAPVLQADLDHRLALATMRKGGFEDALTRVERNAEFTTRHGLLAYDGAHRFVRGWVALEKGDYVTAGSFLRERIGDDHVYPALGAVLAGRPDQAIQLLEAFDYLVEPDAPVRQIEVELDPHLIASHAYELAGDRARALVEVERELAIRRRYGPDFRLAQALRRHASFLPARRAVGLLEEALALADSTPRLPLQIRVLQSYGAALHHAGRDAAAREVLYRAADGAAELGMERLRARAQRELAAAGGRPRRARRTGPTSLTDAQRQVALLAAEGLTNREIAERLFVTIKTVETHLVAVYRKLGLAGRDELASVIPEDRGVQVPAESRFGPGIS